MNLCVFKIFKILYYFRKLALFETEKEKENEFLKKSFNILSSMY